MQPSYKKSNLIRRIQDQIQTILVQSAQIPASVLGDLLTHPLAKYNRWAGRLKSIALEGIALKHVSLASILMSSCIFFVSTIDLPLQAQPTGYGFGKAITINASQVSGPLSSFPVLLSVTDPNLRTVANGGRVVNNNGFDIVFASNACGSALLSHQIEQYNPTTGQYIAWVNVPSLSNVSNTSIYMFYGNSSANSDPSTTATWDTNYRGIWHFNNTVNDASSNSRNLIDNSTSNLTSGIIGQGRDLDNNTNINSSSPSGRYLQLPNNSISGTTNFTFEGWVFMDRDNTFWERIFDLGRDDTSYFLFSPSAGPSKRASSRISISGPAGSQGVNIPESVPNTGSWVHWAVVLDDASNRISIYRNGVLHGTNGGISLTPSSLGNDTANYFGRSNSGFDHYIDAKFDEFRISNTVRSASWIQTAYTNQSSPSTFYSVSPEFTSAAICVALPVTVFHFSLLASQQGVNIHWSATCVNTAQFQVQRSIDGKQWQTLQTITVQTPGQTCSFLVTDSQPVQGSYMYYRIKETDRNGEIDYTAARSVLIPNATQQLTVQPNPASDQFLLEWTAGEAMQSVGNIPAEVVQLSLWDSQGRRVKLPYQKQGNGFVCQVGHLPSGIYILKVQTQHGLLSKRVLVK